VFTKSLLKSVCTGTTFILLVALGSTATVLAKSDTVDCSKNGDLQKAIDAAANGDTIEITGICMGNIVIRDKVVSLVGASSPGPHGITGTKPDTDGVLIENSRGTHLENLVINNPLNAGVRIRYSSDVTMTDCTINDSGADMDPPPGGGPPASSIWVQELSYFEGRRLTLSNNRRGIGALMQSRAWCEECDFSGNFWAASAIQNSLITLLDSSITGPRGMQADEYSYVDLDCDSFKHSTPPHDCSLNASIVAGYSSYQSTVNFFGAGDFQGSLWAEDRSRVGLKGARQTANSNENFIESGSSLRVESGSSLSGLTGTTHVTGFSNALVYGAGTDLNGNSLNCDEGGDAWIQSGVSLTGFTPSGCDHIPAP